MQNIGTVLILAVILAGITLVVGLAIGAIILFCDRLITRRNRTAQTDGQASSAEFQSGDEVNADGNISCRLATKAFCVSNCRFGALSYNEQGKIVFTPENCPFGYNGKPSGDKFNKAETMVTGQTGR